CCKLAARTLEAPLGSPPRKTALHHLGALELLRRHFRAISIRLAAAACSRSHPRPVCAAGTAGTKPCKLLACLSHDCHDRAYCSYIRRDRHARTPTCRRQKPTPRSPSARSPLDRGAALMTSVHHGLGSSVLRTASEWCL